MLPTLEQCLTICENNISFKFKVEDIEGKKVYQFNYFLAKHNDFINPLNQPEDNITVTAEELRGLTFVEQDDGSFKRYLMLHKFFNLGQISPVTIYEIDTDEGKVTKNGNVMCVLSDGSEKLVCDLLEGDSIIKFI